MLNVALLRTDASPTLRPTGSQVTSMLEGRTPVPDLPSDPGISAIGYKKPFLAESQAKLRACL